ncbi:MMPL family transporter [Saccharothrix syringae]|uniref:MMPL family transporter n=1 Tax=Saccharothrix syringae TaxID=103733 RepID=UPI00068EE9C6|nr:MMPL family transporter [Saccharothrix syringae]
MAVLAAPDPIPDVVAAQVFDGIGAAVPTVRVVYDDPRFSLDGGRLRHALVFVGSGGFGGVETEPVRAALGASAPPGVRAELTGLDVLAQGGDVDGPGVFAETAVGAVGALAVLAFVFGSLLAFVPLLVAGISITTTFLGLYGLTCLADVNPLVEFLIALVGLGVAIDYSLLVVTRWREERQRGLGNHDAVVAAVGTAGRTVAFSGFTVALGLVALVVLPVPFLRSIGYAGMLIPLVSVGVTLTALPALLAAFGPRLDWPGRRRELTASPRWTAWVRFVLRHRVACAVLAVAVLGVLTAPLGGLRLGQASSESLSGSGPAHEALRAVRDAGAPAGVLTPVEVLVRGDAAAARAAVADVPGVAFAVDSPARDGYTDVVALPDRETVSATSVGVVEGVREAVRDVPGVVGVAGVGATHLDFRDAVYGNAPLVLAVLTLAVFVLPARAFRSVVLPLKAVLLNFLSLAATFGAVVFFWQWGRGGELLYGIPPTGAITFWIPAMVFAFLFGLSIDYEVFILARVREEYDAVRDTDAAVVAGVARTGRLVTSAALILFLAFAAMSAAPATEVRIFATALGFGVLLDATVVRALLVPALAGLLGRWNWWLPRRVRGASGGGSGARREAGGPRDLGVGGGPAVAGADAARRQPGAAVREGARARGGPRRPGGGGGGAAG